MPELPLSAEEINPDGRRPWAMDDGELAKQIWNKLEPDTQEFLQVLIEDPSTGSRSARSRSGCARARST